MKCSLLLFLGCLLLRSAGTLDSVPPNKSVCGPETELQLTDSGLTSSLSLDLSTDARLALGPCKVRITAPHSHIVHVVMVESYVDDDEEVNVGKDENCVLSVYLPENRRTAVWRTDPCSQDILPEGGLLTHQIRIVWNPPSNKNQARGRRLIVTALGQGEICQSAKQHVCMRVGWSPLMCVAEELMCDGLPHCPSGATISDEDPQLCRERKVLSPSSWEKIAAEFFKKFTGKSRTGSLLPAIQTNDEARWLIGRDMFTTTERQGNGKSKETHSDQSLLGVLSHYGPWGYLMLAMLFCGTVLMLCGLWECCCHRVKPSGEGPRPTRQPAAVLVVGPGPEDAGLPPRYEDLDQPPNYSALFPGKGASVAAVGSDRSGDCR